MHTTLRLTTALLLLLFPTILFSQVNTCSGNYYDTGGSGGNYANNQLYSTTYCSNSGNCIEVTFTSFSLESGWDYLTLYDGPSTASPAIGTYSGTTLQGQTITSSTGCITLEFDSDGSVTYPGWTMAVNCVACPVPTCSDGIQNQGETGIDCGGPCPACPAIVQPTSCANLTYNITIPGSSVAFYDDGGPGGDPCADVAGGGNYCNCGCFTTTTICAAPGEYIYVDFHEFAMWNTTSGWDWMKIYDNSTASGTVLYDNSSSGPDNPFGDCGIGTAPMEFCSSGQCLTFEFWATSVVNRAGWDATVYSTPIICAIPLPVELADFRGQNEGSKNVLYWKTYSEENNDYFQLERSVDGKNWEVLSYVNGAGNSQSTLNYSSEDRSFKNSLNYYRLTQVDMNGESKTFNVVTIDNRHRDRELVKVTNLMGQEVPIDSKGPVLEIYSDGTVERVYRK